MPLAPYIQALVDTKVIVKYHKDRPHKVRTPRKMDGETMPVPPSAKGKEPDVHNTSHFQRFVGKSFQAMLKFCAFNAKEIAYLKKNEFQKRKIYKDHLRALGQEDPISDDERLLPTATFQRSSTFLLIISPSLLSPLMMTMMVLRMMPSMMMIHRMISPSTPTRSNCGLWTSSHLSLFGVLYTKGREVSI